MPSRNTHRALVTAIAVLLGAVPLCAADAPTASDVGLRAVDTRPESLRRVAAETRYWSRLSSLLGSGDLRRLHQAQNRFQVEAAFSDDPLQDPLYEHNRNTVRDGYLKLYKEVLRREYVQNFVDDTLRQHLGSELKSPGESWGLRISPRLAIGRHGYVGATFDAPHSPSEHLQNFSLQVQHGIGDSEMHMGLSYGKGNKYWEIERVTGDPSTGARVAGSFVLRF
jgi:hypothetical protein